MLRRLAGPLLLVLALGTIGLGVKTLTDTSQMGFHSGGWAVDPAVNEASVVWIDCGSALTPRNDDVCDGHDEAQRTGLLQVAMGVALGGISWLAFRSRRSAAPADAEDPPPLPRAASNSSITR